MTMRASYTCRPSARSGSPPAGARRTRRRTAPSPAERPRALTCAPSRRIGQLVYLSPRVSVYMQHDTASVSAVAADGTRDGTAYGHQRGSLTSANAKTMFGRRTAAPAPAAAASPAPAIAGSGTRQEALRGRAGGGADAAGGCEYSAVSESQTLTECVTAAPSAALVRGSGSAPRCL